MPKHRLFSLAVAVLTLGGLAYAGQASFSSSSHETYLVHAGDSLWSISQAHDVTVQQLAATNGMSLTDVLLIGRTLVIPTAGATTPTPTTTATTTSPVSPAPPSPTTPEACPTPAGAGLYGVLPEMSAAEASLRPLFVQWAQAYGVSPALVEAVAWQESGWQESVVSGAHAVGVGQLIPATSDFVGRYLIGERLNVRSAGDNIRMTARFIAYLESVEGGNLCHTIAAYYEGPGNLAEHGIFAMSVPYIADVEALIPRFE
jgi:N-acetylmuramoyl-L-alanine amidase